MNYTTKEHEQARSDMLGELNRAITDAEDQRTGTPGGRGEAAVAERETAEATPGNGATGPAGALEAPAEG